MNYIVHQMKRIVLEFAIGFQNDLLVLDCDYDTSEKEIITKVGTKGKKYRFTLKTNQICKKI